MIVCGVAFVKKDGLFPMLKLMKLIPKSRSNGSTIANITSSRTTK